MSVCVFVCVSGIYLKLARRVTCVEEAFGRHAVLTTTCFSSLFVDSCYRSNVDPPIWYDTDIRLFEIQRI